MVVISVLILLYSPHVILRYVMQEEALMPTLTVQETLLYAAELRLPVTMSKLQKLRRVCHVCDVLFTAKALISTV